MKKLIAVAATAVASLTFTGTAMAAHQHVDNPSGCHDTASRAGVNSGGKSKWNSNAGNQANDNSPVISAGTCDGE